MRHGRPSAAAQKSALRHVQELLLQIGPRFPDLASGAAAAPAAAVPLAAPSPVAQSQATPRASIAQPPGADAAGSAAALQLVMGCGVEASSSRPIAGQGMPRALRRLDTKRRRTKRLSATGCQLQVASGSRRSSRPVSVAINRVRIGTARPRGGQRQRGPPPSAAQGLDQLAASLAATVMGAGLLGTDARRSIVAVNQAAAGPAEPSPVQQGPLSGPVVGLAALAAGSKRLSVVSPPGAAGASSLEPAGGGDGSRGSIKGGAPKHAAPRTLTISDSSNGSGNSKQTGRQPAASPRRVGKASPSSPASLSPVAAGVAARSPASPDLGVVGGGVLQPRRREPAARSQASEPARPGTAAGIVAVRAVSSGPPARPVSRHQQQQQGQREPARRAAGEGGAAAHPARTSPFKPASASRPATAAGPEGEPHQGHPRLPAAPARLVGTPPAARPPSRSPPSVKGVADAPADKRQQREQHEARTRPFRPSTAAAAVSQQSGGPGPPLRPATSAAVVQVQLHPPGQQQQQPAQRRPSTSGAPPGPQAPVQAQRAQHRAAPLLHAERHAVAAKRSLSRLGPHQSPPAAGLQAEASQRSVVSLPELLGERSLLAAQESSWLAESSCGGEGSEQLVGAVDAAAELAAWRASRRAAQPRPLGSLLAALPGDLHDDLFQLLLRQRQYVGGKGAHQSHQRKMKRLLRRLASLERCWQEHPVHQRISKGALQAIQADIVAAAAEVLPPKPAAAAVSPPVPAPAAPAGSSPRPAPPPGPAPTPSAVRPLGFDFAFALLRRGAAEAADVGAGSSGGSGGSDSGSEAATPVWSARGAAGGFGSGLVPQAAGASQPVDGHQASPRLAVGPGQRSATPSPPRSTALAAAAGAASGPAIGQQPPGSPLVGGGAALEEAAEAPRPGSSAGGAATAALARLKSSRRLAAAQRPGSPLPGAAPTLPPPAAIPVAAAQARRLSRLAGEASEGRLNLGAAALSAGAGIAAQLLPASRSEPHLGWTSAAAVPASVPALALRPRTPSLAGASVGGEVGPYHPAAGPSALDRLKTARQSLTSASLATPLSGEGSAVAAAGSSSGGKGGEAVGAAAGPARFEIHAVAAGGGPLLP